MRIGVEASRANRTERTGVEWYACRIMEALAALPAAAAHAWIAYARRPLRTDVRAAIPGWEERILPWPLPYLWTQVALSREMQQYPPDVLFLPAHALPRILPKKTVVTVHDVGFRRFPDLYKKIQIAYHEIMTREIVRSSARILTVSEFSKHELVELYGASPSRIMVTPLAVDHGLYQPQPDARQAQIRAKYRLERPFLLFIGRREEKKNVERLVRAFCAVADRLPDGAELVLVGPEGRGWAKTDQWLRSHPLRARVRVLGYLPEEEKPALLSAAACYIQPSLYEGFGIPVLEAMACATPVLCSDIPALRETVGAAHARFFDPYSIEALSVEIERAFQARVAADPGVIQANRAHAQAHTWTRTAEQTLSALLS